LLDHRSSDIASFYARVAPIAQGLLGNVLQHISNAQPIPQQGEAINGVRSILEILAAKA
jgi:hypothetical protein